MPPQTDGDHQKLLTEVIKKQIVVLGPDITLTKARNVKGITVSDDGTVTGLTGDPQEITKQLVEQFMELSGLIVKKTMEPLLASYPGLDGAISQATTQPTMQTISTAAPTPAPVQTAPIEPQPAITQAPVQTPTPPPAEPNLPPAPQAVINEVVAQVETPAQTQNPTS